MKTKNGLVPVQEAGRLPTVTTYPCYDRSKLGCGVAHMSEGNFHRSHQALFWHEYLQSHPEEPWMIHGIGLLGPDIELVRNMNSQDNLYTLTERSGSRDTLKVIGSIKEVWHAPADPQQIIELLASDHIKIVSLTVTEGGYYYDAAHRLDIHNRIIDAELRPGSTPTTTLGYLFSAARLRMEREGSPFTVMSCDNLPGNGDLCRSLLLEFASLKDRTVADWIEANISFPNSMVDRITPKVTDDMQEFVRNTFGIVDKCPVVSEAYLQWVLEDNFKGGRPQLETVSVPVQLESESMMVQVQFTRDVRPYETIKMRLLNGSHSALAYVAYLLGHRRVDEAMKDPDLLVRTFVQRYMDDDVTPTLLTIPDTMSLAEYKGILIQRFSNAAIADQVQRLAEDGSAKIRNFIVPPLKHQLEVGGSIRWIAFALAAWFQYLRGIDEMGAPITIKDPMRDVLMARAKDDPMQLLSLTAIFGEEIAANRRIAAEVKGCLDAINTSGTAGALHDLLET